jgi:hypothetical protein
MVTPSARHCHGRLHTTKATIDVTVKFFSVRVRFLFTADGMIARDQKIKLFA